MILVIQAPLLTSRNTPLLPASGELRSTVKCLAIEKSPDCNLAGIYRRGHSFLASDITLPPLPLPHALRRPAALGSASARIHPPPHTPPHARRVRVRRHRLGEHLEQQPARH